MTESMSVERAIGAAETARGYARAVTVTNPDRLVFLSGSVNYDESRTPVTTSFEAAARAMFDRLGETLAEAGGGFSDLVTVTVYLTDARWCDEFARIRLDYLDPEALPASALLVVTGLGRPELIVEVQAVAAIAGRPVTPANAPTTAGNDRDD